MNTNSSPSRYRYCISRLSTLATSTLTPALKVRSTTLPVITFFSLVRTNAPPLPGLTCWKSTTPQSWPSRLRVMPFFRSLVVATFCRFSCGGCLLPGRVSWLQDEQVPGARGEQLGRAGPGPHHQGVLDPDAALARQVDAGLDGDGNAGRESTGPYGAQHGCLVDLQAHAVPEAVAEVIAVPGGGDHVPGRRVLRRGDERVQVALPGGGRAERDGPGQVGVVAAEQGPAVDRDQVAVRQRTAAGRVMRGVPVRPAGHDRVEGRLVRAAVGHLALQR